MCIYIYILCNVFVGWELCKAALLEVVVAELWSFYCSVVLTWGVSSLDIGTLMGEWHTAILLILHPKTLISMLHLHNVGREEPIVIGVYRNMCVNICISIYIEYTKWKCYGTAPFKTTGKPSSFFWYLFGQERTKKKKRKEPLKMWSKIGRTLPLPSFQARRRGPGKFHLLEMRCGMGLGPKECLMLTPRKTL